MTRNVVLAWSAILCMGCVRSAAPLGVFSSDRPGFSDSPGLVPRGRIQVETGYSYTHQEAGSYQSIGEFLVRIGISQRVEVRTHLNSYALRNKDSERVNGLEDSKIGLKYLLSAKSKGFCPTISVLAQASIPTGGSAFSKEKIVAETKVAASWSGSSPISLNANAGINWGQPNKKDGVAFVTAAPWMTINRSLSAFAELYATMPMAGAADESSEIDGGIAWLVTRNTQLDFRIGTSIKADSPHSFFGGGFAVRW